MVTLFFHPDSPDGPRNFTRKIQDVCKDTGKTVPELGDEAVQCRKLLVRKGNVFFALDSSDLTDEARATLQKNAEFMKKWSSVRVSVEGHCDERGTAEYNLGLGERRAKAVQGYLAGLGLTADRVATVSKGKEQPVCTERAEGCYSQNRRGHFIFTAK